MFSITRAIPKARPCPQLWCRQMPLIICPPLRSFSVMTQHASPKITTHFGKDCSPPRAGVPYSPAAKAGGFVFVSGQVAANPKGEYLPTHTSVMEKSHRMIQNVKSVLEASGSSLDKVVKANIIFVHLDRDYDEFNKVYQEYFPHNPARTSIEVSGLPKPADLEIEVIALA
ncbi:hypothetical protein ASPWEDRAFT_179638 [Aspergillus wentii DTO 134E9]|uniref:Uncharacterized protein n=1 Tax=Aspergillus wentii DTO 134E9 TaxID=1073089 RepID=A0A1L9RSY1_ASPWE|nr:uncharacterized protein ASPWEDRAFT_179638 [Aspergillus wentii DTO 134E9]KAI9933692.1 hypothetical protein MW887_004763 [Aspergillus wentii]OJJ38029.1 hypothetical protein ASPWEDRAFT_179638 [Aspergillus wentii DTO 134E9]